MFLVLEWTVPLRQKLSLSLKMEYFWGRCCWCTGRRHHTPSSLFSWVTIQLAGCSPQGRWLQRHSLSDWTAADRSRVPGVMSQVHQTQFMLRFWFSWVLFIATHRLLLGLQHCSTFYFLYIANFHLWWQFVLCMDRLLLGVSRFSKSIIQFNFGF